MFNGYFSVVKAESKDVEPDADEVRKLRGIWHLVPSNSVQTCIPGDIALLPNPMAWGHMHLEVLEIILITTRDRSSYFNLFFLPPCWRGGFALQGAVRAEKLKNCAGSGPRILCSRVLAMGWKSAVGITHEAHRSILALGVKRPPEMPLVEDSEEALMNGYDCAACNGIAWLKDDLDGHDLWEGHDPYASQVKYQCGMTDDEAAEISSIGSSLAESEGSLSSTSTVFDPIMPLDTEVRRDRPFPLNGATVKRHSLFCLDR